MDEAELNERKLPGTLSWDGAVGELTGNVAHDFNNLLQVIQTANEVVMKSTVLTAAEREMLEISSKSVEAGAKMVHQMLSFAQQQSLNPVGLSVGSYLETCERIASSLLPSQYAFEMNVETEKGAAIAVDVAQLTAALESLILNAVDAMEGAKDGAGVITLSVAGVQVSREDSTWSDVAEGAYVQFSLSDTGSGMTDEQKNSACKPFYSTKNSGMGRGLGLSSVYGFARQSGGSLRIVDPEGSTGVCVQLLFPACEMPDKVEEIGTHLPISNCKILLVEDKQEVGASLLARIRALGFEADMAHNETSAVERLQAQDSSYDLVLSDIQMPNRSDGLRLKKWINAHHPYLPVVLMTGYNGYDPAELDAIILQKPFTEDELLAAMATECARRDRETPSFSI